MAYFIQGLYGTGAARWYARSRGQSRPPAPGEDPVFGATRAETPGDVEAKRSWATRRRYYDALLAVLAEVTASAGDDEVSRVRVSREALVSRAGQERPSTLYYLVGKQSAGSLLRHLDERIPGFRGSQAYHDVVENLIAEVKVWSYWPWREGWLAQLAAMEAPSRHFAAESMIRVLAEWAGRHRGLAGAVGNAPPVAAVEDLLVVCPRAMPIRSATHVLTRTVETALGPREMSPFGVLNEVHSELTTVGFETEDRLNDVLAGLAESLGSVEALLPRLVPAELRRVSEELVPYLTSVLSLVSRPS
jgi:hypothetical protein